MISLDKIVSSNLEMLKSQEADLLKSLSFVQKAKQLFQSHWGPTPAAPAKKSSGKKRGRPAKSKNKPKVTVAAPTVAAPKAAAVTKLAAPKAKKAAAKKAKAAPAKTGEKKSSHISNIMTILNSGDGIGSGQLIDTLFKQQSADKDIKHFRLLIYPVLTKAYASKTLLLKDGKIYLPK